MNDFMLAAYPRLHFGLVDLSGATARAYGGAGVSFNGPCVRVHGSNLPRLELDMGDLAQDVEIKILEAVSRVQALGLQANGSVTIVTRPPSHIGLGCSTAATLAVLQTLALLNCWKLSQTEIITLSGRGRTSGIGCNAFFTGGLVVDLGQPLRSRSGHYAPSMTPGERLPSLYLGTWPMPSDWVLTLLFSDRKPTLDPNDEVSFFLQNSPTDARDSLVQLGYLFHGIIPAILEHNIDQLAASMRGFQSCGFKEREIASQPANVRDALTALWERGLAAGLSSLGPTVFVVHESDGVAVDVVRSLTGDSMIPSYTFRNLGYEIRQRGEAE